MQPSTQGENSPLTVSERTPDAGGWPAYPFASSGQQTFFETATLDEVRARLDAGADPNFADSGNDDNTPLHEAAFANRNPEIVFALIEAGAKVDKRNGLERTPLMIAAERSMHPEIVGALLDAGASVAAKTKISITPLHFAAYRQDDRDVVLPIVERLLQAGAVPDAANHRDETPLHFAACSDDSGMVVARLIQAGADPERADSRYGRRPLHLAANRLTGPPSASVEALLAGGADPNATDTHAATPLFWAALSANPVATDMLLRRRAHPDIPNHNGDTPLFAAVGMNNARFDARATAAARLLLEAGASLSTTNYYGGTPLHIAAHSGNPGGVQLLLEAGADPAAATDYGDTPLDLARRSGGTEKIALLEAALAAQARNDPRALPEPTPT